MRQLDRAVKEFGFKALRVLPWLWKVPPNDKLYFPLYVKCIELGIPFCTQVGHTGPLMPSETGRPMIAVAWKHENVYIDTSAYLPRFYPPQLLHFMNSYGQDKVLFGTNFPMLSLAECAKQALALELKPAAKAKFLLENANRVFALD